MTEVIPCERNAELKSRIESFAETLKHEAHRLGNHGLSEAEFYDSGLFRGAIERIRGQFAASMIEKRKFAEAILDHLAEKKLISEWASAGDNNRHDYSATLNSGKIAAIELKGCLDGNNTNIYERPAQAEEFIIWSICTNPGADPRHNVWSGIHTRLSAEIISSNQVVNGLIVWDMVCGTIGRPCPKLDHVAKVKIADYSMPPPCIYTFPPTVPSPRNNPEPKPSEISDVEILNAFKQCFNCTEHDINQVKISVQHQAAETLRTTSISRSGKPVRTSAPTAIRRS